MALVEEGQLGAAIRALNSDPPAPVDDDSYKKMVERHQSSAPPVCPEVKSESHVVEVRNVSAAVRAFHTTSAGGMSGLRPSHLKFLLGAISLVEVQNRITAVVNRLLQVPAGGHPPVCVGRQPHGAG
jgi:hypothetical protein